MYLRENPLTAVTVVVAHMLVFVAMIRGTTLDVFMQQALVLAIIVTAFQLLPRLSITIEIEWRLLQP